MSAREAILAAVRRANAAAADSAAWTPAPRGYRVSSGEPRAKVIARFEERLKDYDATVTRVVPDQLGAAAVELLRGLAVPSVCVPDGLELPLADAGIDVLRDDGLSYAALDACACVATVCSLGIAETGTIVLQSGPGMGRRALTLVPDVHLCIVRTSQVVASVPEALRALRGTAQLPTTFVSGPSATADIEMTRVKGVHGPRFLHVLLVNDDADGLWREGFRSEKKGD